LGEYKTGLGQSDEKLPRPFSLPPPDCEIIPGGFAVVEILDASTPRPMLVKRAIRTSLLTAAIIAALFVWFYLLPRSQFSIGMTLTEVERRLGHKAYVIPLRRTDEGGDPAYSAYYMISVNRYGLHLYLNADMRVVRIVYLLGSTQHPHFRE
jgi:hypothetical protein